MKGNAWNIAKWPTSTPSVVNKPSIEKYDASINRLAARERSTPSCLLVGHPALGKTAGRSLWMSGKTQASASRMGALEKEERNRC